MVLPPKQAVRWPPTPLLGKALPKQETASPQVRQAVKVLGQAGKTPGIQPGKGPPQASQGNSTASQAESTGCQESNLTPTPPNRLPQGSFLEDPNHKWVINLSSKPMTPAQRSVLGKGPNFVVSPKQPPNLEYITAIEAACTKLGQQDAEKLRAEVNIVPRSSQPPNPT